jgi:hypothetical protein
MSDTRSSFVVLDRGSKTICRNPSVDDVLSLMEVMAAGPERGGAPEALQNRARMSGWFISRFPAHEVPRSWPIDCRNPIGSRLVLVSGR